MQVELPDPVNIETGGASVEPAHIPDGAG